MKYLFKIIATILLVILVLTHKQIIRYIGFESTNEVVVTEMNAETDIAKKVLEQSPTPIFTSHTIRTTPTKPIAINWKLLMDIDFQLDYYEAYEMDIETPIFTDAVKEIDGKEVIIKGYIIPIDESGKQIVLSANPFSSCFFCGNASPASIIGMNLKEKGHYKMDASIKFLGTLRLNYDDPEEFYYILDNAVPVK